MRVDGLIERLDDKWKARAIDAESRLARIESRMWRLFD